MKKFTLILIFSLAANTALSDQIPIELQGFWESEDSRCVPITIEKDSIEIFPNIAYCNVGKVRKKNK
jgi:hypothetical protein